MSQAPEVSMRTVSGASDYLGASIVLKVALRKDGVRHHREYLFGVGSGIARAVLEHKCRPSRNLRAAFSCTLDSSRCGGLGGLLLRLRADGHGKVTFVGPNGVAAQVQALQNLSRWSHPTVTVSEFPDMDDGKPAYEDDAIVVFAITKPSTPWNKPHLCTATPEAAVAENTNIVDDHAKAEEISSSSGSSSASQSASEEVPREEPEVGSDGKGHTTAESSSESDDESDDESSSDSETNNKDGNLQSLQQQQLFQHIVSNIRGSIAQARVQSRQPLQGAGPGQPRKISDAVGGKPVEKPGEKRARTVEQTALTNAPKRVRSAVNAQQASRKGPVVNNWKASSVVVARCATGTISKQSSGASGFLVQVEQLRSLVRHPVIPFLKTVVRPPGNHTAAAAGATTPRAGSNQLCCLHMCSPALHGVGTFHKLLDHLPSSEHFSLEQGVLANKGFAHCAVVRLQAKLNLLDPTVFRLPVHLSAPPLKALWSTVSDHTAAGTEPTPQSLSQGCLNAPGPAHTQGHSTLLKAAPNKSKTTENKEARDTENGAPGQRGTSTFASTGGPGDIERAEAACTKAEAAEAEANAAKCELDKARAALSAVDAALAASSASVLKDKLDSARLEADQVVKERSAAHMKALARMREAAEVAEAACSAAEHAASVDPRTEQPTFPSTGAVAPQAPRPPAAPPLIQESASLSLKRAGAIMLGTLSELHWPHEAAASCTATTEDDEHTQQDFECLEDGRCRTAHGTVVQGSCLRVEADEGGGIWVPCHGDVLAAECPVDVMCVQARTLLLHKEFAEGLVDVRQVLKALRGLCASPCVPPGALVLYGSQPCHQNNQHPAPQGPFLASGPEMPNSAVSLPSSFLVQHKASDSEVQVHDKSLSDFLKQNGVPENPQQAISVLGPWPAAASFWNNTTVTFLGTGSSEPSKYRGPSALLLEVGSSAAGGGATMLLDCGEGTWQTMCTMLGKQRAQMCVNSLAAVWISHKHADHCLGLPCIIAARSPQRPPLTLALPAAVESWIREGYPYLLDRVKYVHCSRFSSSSAAASHTAGGGGGRPLAGGRGAAAGRDSRDTMAAAGFTAWQCVRVKHCFDAHGIVLEHSQGWKVVVSGDTEPCQQLIEAGMNATLLVHEATFSCDLAADAAAKRHSTIGQALEAAQKMGAWRVVLTHFSQRYGRFCPDLKQLPYPAAARAFSVFDGTRVRFQDLWLLPVVSRAMETIITETAEEAAEQAAQEVAKGAANGNDDEASRGQVQGHSAASHPGL